MAEEKWTCIVDKDLRPAYYDSFHCLMGDCRMSCCKGGWQIAFSKKDYLNLKKHVESQPALAKSMEHGLHRLRGDDSSDKKYAEMRLDEQGCCRMLTEDGLCGLQVAAGEKALPDVCRNYPRMGITRISGYLERALSPSCEAVLHQLWELPEGVDFLSDPLPQEEWKKGEESSPSYLIPWYHDIRAVCISLLQDRSIPLNQRIFLMGLRLQALRDETVDIPRWLAETEALLTVDKSSLLQGLLNKDTNTLYMNLINNITLLSNANAADFLGIKAALLETLGIKNEETEELSPEGEGETPSERIQNQQRYTFDSSKYREMQAEFERIYGEREYFFENLAVSILFQSGYPNAASFQKMWKDYVTFCQIWSFYHFFSVLSVRAQLPPLRERPGEVPPAPGSREALFQLLVTAGRAFLHNEAYTDTLLDRLYKHDSATLAHMAILLGG